MLHDSRANGAQQEVTCEYSSFLDEASEWDIVGYSNEIPTRLIVLLFLWTSTESCYKYSNFGYFCDFHTFSSALHVQSLVISVEFHTFNNDLNFKVWLFIYSSHI